MKTKQGNIALGKNPGYNPHGHPRVIWQPKHERHIRLMCWELLLSEVFAGLLLVIEPGNPADTDDLVEGAKSCHPIETADLFREEALQVVPITNLDSHCGTTRRTLWFSFWQL